LSDFVSEPTGDGLEGALAKREALAVVCSSSEQVTEDIERQLAVGIAEVAFLLRRQAEVGDAAADYAGQDRLERRRLHLGRSPPGRSFERRLALRFAERVGELVDDPAALASNSSNTGHPAGDALAEPAGHLGATAGRYYV
jgi:hypothetical protein